MVAVALIRGLALPSAVGLVSTGSGQRGSLWVPGQSKWQGWALASGRGWLAFTSSGSPTHLTSEAAAVGVCVFPQGVSVHGFSEQRVNKVRAFQPRRAARLSNPEKHKNTDSGRAH